MGDSQEPHSMNTQSHSGASPDSLAVNRREAARMLGISERLLWGWTKAGHIPHARIGARVLYPVDALRRWLDDQSVTAPRPGN